MRNFCVVFARGGSKGIPNKNIRDFCGSPLIVHTIKFCQAAEIFDRIIVSTDSEEIATISEAAGAEIPFIRPSHLASETASEFSAWKHCANFLIDNCDAEGGDLFCSLPATAPLRNKQDVCNGIAEFKSNNSDIVLSVTESSRSPYFNMLKSTKDGYETVCRTNQSVTRRQDVPATYDIATVGYFTSFNYVLNAKSLMSGKVGVFMVPKLRAIDIDDLEDFHLAELILKQRNMTCI